VDSGKLGEEEIGDTADEIPEASCRMYVRRTMVLLESRSV
jgi:hypothetical protein